MVDKSQFPHLFAPAFWAWGPMHAQFEMLTTPPADALISNINIVAFVGSQCVIIQTTDKRWEIIGGTREPDEPYLETVRRELLEEAGAKFINFTPFALWDCHSEAVKPYRPHLPHPHFYRLVGYGEVELVGQPSNPPDGEQIALVELVSVEEAARRYRSINRHEFADLVLLADIIRQREHTK